MMKKFFFAVALFSAFAAHAEQVMSQTRHVGNLVQSRTLSQQGVLTESTCAREVRGDVVLQDCVSQSTKLTRTQAKAIAGEMQSAAAALNLAAALSMAQSSNSASRDSRRDSQAAQRSAKEAWATQASFSEAASQSMMSSNQESLR